MKKICLILSLSLVLVSCNSSQVKIDQTEYDKLLQDQKDYQTLQGSYDATLDDFDSYKVEQEDYLNSVLEDHKAEIESLQNDLEDLKDIIDTADSDHSNTAKLLQEQIDKYNKLTNDYMILEDQYARIQRSTDFARGSTSEALRQGVYEYFKFEEDYGDFTRENLEALYTLAGEGLNRMSYYFYYDHADVDYEGEDPIHKDPIFQDEMYGYKLVTEFDSLQAFEDYWKTYFTEDMAKSIIESHTGEPGSHKRYLVYKNKLFVRPGDMGYFIERVQPKDSKYRVIEHSSELLRLEIMEVITGEYMEIYASITPIIYEFRLEEDGWKFFGKFDVD